MELLGILHPSGGRGRQRPSRFRLRELCALGGLGVNSDFVLSTVDFPRPPRHHSQLGCHDRSYPALVRQLVLVGAVVGGFPYTDHFLNRGISNSQPFEKNDVPSGLANWAKDKYLLAPGHAAAQKRLLDLLTA